MDGRDQLRPAGCAAGGAKCVTQELEASRGPKRAASRGAKAARIEDWEGDRSALGDARRIPKQLVENRGGPDAAEQDAGGSA